MRVLQSQIAMTPRGSYRSALDKHLNETRRHASRVSDRLSELGAGSNPVTAVIEFWEDMLGQALALGKAPLDLLRGSGGEEKVLRTARQARQVPSVAQAEGQGTGVAGEDDLAIADYDDLTGDEINSRLPGLSQVDLAKVDSYERRHQNRSLVLSRLSTLSGAEPWAGYDELTADEIPAALRDADDELVSRVRGYERSHKDRAGVLRATEQRAANS